MKKNIFTQEWMSMHPYKKADDVDLYYTNLANKIYNALDSACFTHQFKEVQEAKYLALCITAYFEDVISGTGIWKAFTTECKKRYGVYVPFYQEGTAYENSLAHKNGIEDRAYDQDDINIADIKFLLWHHSQQSITQTEILPPLFGSMEIAAKLTYDVLDAEYETAPENERLHKFVCDIPTDEKNFYEYRNVLEWFHYGCYFHIGNRERFIFEVRQAIASGGYTELAEYAARMMHMVDSRNNLLALTSAEWLAKVSEMHPAHRLWTDIEYRESRLYAVKKEDAEYIYVKDLLQNDTIKVAKASLNVDDYTPFLKGEKLMFAAMFRFGGAWWQYGVMADCENDKAAKKAIQDNRDRFNHKKQLHDYSLLKDNGYGAQFLFANSIKDVKEFYKEIGYKDEINVRQPNGSGGIIVYGSPYTGLHITFGLAHCICSPDNPFYDSERAEINCFDIISGRGHAFPYEIVCMLIAGNMLPDANMFSSKYVKEIGKRITQENLQFLADYYLMGRKDKDLSPVELW